VAAAGFVAPHQLCEIEARVMAHIGKFCFRGPASSLGEALLSFLSSVGPSDLCGV
jgi:hypothetical protein